mgnify:CR=1 FL=1
MSHKEIKVSKTNTLKHILNNLDEYIIKIDYFDQKGFKDFENNIPLNYIFNSNIKSPKTKTNSKFF